MGRNETMVCFLSKNSDLILILVEMKEKQTIYIHFQHISQSWFCIKQTFSYEMTTSIDPKSKTNEQCNTAHLGGSLAKREKVWNLFNSEAEVSTAQSKISFLCQSHQLLNPLLNANSNEFKLLMNTYKTCGWSALKCQGLRCNMLIIYA